MTFLEQLKQEHILIIGFGFRTGLATANYFAKKGIRFSISDSKSSESLRDLVNQLQGNAENLYFGPQDNSQLDNIDRIILSPGVPRRIALVQEAIKRNIPVTGEIELGYLLCKPKLVIGITGTDGKTTTTTLIYEILKQEEKVKLGGNIGIPFISFIDEVDSNTIVLLELSSYQLEDVPFYNSNVACILNVSPDHLDRYGSFDDYLNAKLNIFKNQSDNDFAIINLDDPHHEKISKAVNSQKIFFSRNHDNSNTYINSNKDVNWNNIKIANITNIPLKGLHNEENILAALSIVKLVGISDESIQKVLNTFKGLPHRNEFIAEHKGISFINDSKATTINSVLKSLNSLDYPVTLLLGGQDKGLDFTELQDSIIEKVKTLILFGEAKDKIKANLNFENTLLCNDLEEAFKQAVVNSTEGSILLSPACTSFDQYKSYEERGHHFKSLVDKYINS